jgi:hypothetical protein
VAWVLTKELQAFRDQMNMTFPNRDRTSDGTIGDAAHQAEKSGHNSDLTANAEYKDGDAKDEVRAIDVDSDTGNPDVSMEDVVQHLLRLARAGQLWFIRYMIFNRRIWAASTGWTQQAYTGPSPHTEHLHLSGAYSQAADELASANYHLEDLVALTDTDIDKIVARIFTYDPGVNADGSVKGGGISAATYANKGNGTVGLGTAISSLLSRGTADHNTLGAILTAATEPENTTALAQAIAATLVPAVVSSLAGVVQLTEAQVQEASERAVRVVLGSVDGS